MVRRWVAAGDAERHRSFRRIKGCKDTTQRRRQADTKRLLSSAPRRAAGG